MWDDRYRASDLVWSAGPNIFLPPITEELSAGTALDVACGEGRNAIWLARQGWSVTAVDFSRAGIDKARQLAGDASVDWIVADATSFQPDKTFDLVVIFYLHLPIPELTSAFRRAVDSVAVGGTFFAVGHALSNLTGGYGGPPYPEILWSKDRISSLVDGLDIRELGERERYVKDADATAIDFVALGTKSGP